MKTTFFTNFFKKNYEFLLSIFLLTTILIMSFFPTNYVKASYQGLKIWATIVLPSLFVFFFTTKLLMQLKSGRRLLSIIDKPFNKIYDTKSNSGYIFFLSIISGYPIGAKLIEEFYNDGYISLTDAKKTISFCSTSGPMFILGSIATQMFKNYNLGVIVLLSHIIATLLNGLLYRNIGTKLALKNTKNISYNQNKENKKSINDIMYDSIISIFMIGGYITLCFTFLEFLLNLPFFNLTSNFSNQIFGADILSAILKGFIELTNGCVSLSKINCNIKTTCIILSSLISFGGLSIHLQSYYFLKKIGISYKFFLITKTTQTIITIITSVFFSAFLL